MTTFVEAQAAVVTKITEKAQSATVTSEDVALLGSALLSVGAGAVDQSDPNVATARQALLNSVSSLSLSADPEQLAYLSSVLEAIVEATSFNEFVAYAEQQKAAIDATATDNAILSQQIAADRNTVLTYKNAAETAKTDAVAAKNAAVAAQSAAATSETNALASKNAAATSAGQALTSKNAAATSATNAAGSATAAANSASSITGAVSSSAASASAASDSAAAALASKNAAKTSETNAAGSATSALASKTAASTSETNALASKNAAKTSETNAAGSATSALASKTAAGSSATNASDYATAALASKNAAATSATNAATSETNASASAGASATARDAAQAAQAAAEAARDEASAIASVDAIAVGFTPTDELASTNVQAAIEELATRPAVDLGPLTVVDAMPSKSIVFTDGLVPVDLSFTRASGALRTKQSGLMESVASNAMRHDYDPLTGEYLGFAVGEPVTNLFLSSADLRWTSDGNPIQSWGPSNTSNISATSELTDEVAPSGSYFTKLTRVGSGDWRQSRGITGGSTIVTALTFKRTPNENRPAFQMHATGGSIGTVINVVYYNWDTDEFVGKNEPGATITNGGIARGYGRELLAEDVVRIWCATEVNAENTTAYMLILPTANDTVGNYSLVTDAQLTPNWATLPPVVKTTNEAATQSLDLARMPLGDWFRQDEGTIVFDCEFSALDKVNGALLALYSSDGGEYLNIWAWSGSSQKPGAYSVYSRFKQNGVFTGTANSPIQITTDKPHRFGLTWKVGVGFSLACDGVVFGTNTDPLDPFTVPLTTLGFGEGAENAIPGFVRGQKRYRSFSYYPRHHSDADLARMTRLAA